MKYQEQLEFNFSDELIINVKYEHMEEIKGHFVVTNYDGTKTVPTSSIHPVFQSLRNYLCNHGYIRINSKQKNQDVVLKEFTLNGVKFLTGDVFFGPGSILVYLKRKTNVNHVI